jgi:hypothetical protein
LVVALSRLGDPAIAERQAEIIHPLMLAVMAQTTARGRDIGDDEAGGSYARTKTKTAGSARELRDLRGKARKVLSGKLDNVGWITAWAALPVRTKSRLWRPLLIQEKTARSFLVLNDTKSRLI